jgi:hypothetical protein
VLRCPAHVVRTAVVEGSAALRPALPGLLDYRRPLETSARGGADRPLRDALDDVARTGGVSPGPTAAELGHELWRRRSRWWLAAAAACCGAVLVAVVVLSGGPPADPAAASPTRPSERSPGLPAPVDIAMLPTRGSLAGDDAFLAGVRELPWTDEVLTGFENEVTTAPETRRVLFAGDVPGGRWALLVGRPELVDPAVVAPGAPAPVLDDNLMAWFRGPPGAAPEQMRLASYPYGLAPGWVPSLHDPRTGTLVVVAAPGHVVEFSQRVDIDAAGRDSRAWSTVQTPDGVAVARLDPVDLAWTWAVVFRVIRDGHEWLTSSPDGVLVPPQEQFPRLELEYPTPPSEDGRTAAEYATLAALGPTGVSPADVTITVLALAPVPAPAAGVLALVTVRLPSGAVLVSTQWARNGPDGLLGGSDCGMEVLPAEPAPEDGVLVARCELYDPSSGQPFDEVLLVVAPPRVAVVRIYRGDSEFLGEHAVPEDGVLVVPAPDGAAEIEAVTEGGVLLGRSSPLGRWAPSD